MLDVLDIGPDCEDAQELHRQYPATFQAPDRRAVDAIGPGDTVKISRNAERFWLLCVAREGAGWNAKIIGTVNNYLVQPANADLPVGRPVCVQARHLYDTWLRRESRSFLGQVLRVKRH